jgi:hypothetical protein
MRREGKKTNKTIKGSKRKNWLGSVTYKKTGSKLHQKIGRKDELHYISEELSGKKILFYEKDLYKNTLHKKHSSKGWGFYSKHGTTRNKQAGIKIY